MPTGSRRDRLIAKLTIWWWIPLIWFVSCLAFIFPGVKNLFALVPRDVEQWWGPLTFSFVHFDMQHLFLNSVPLLFFSVLLKIGDNSRRHLVIPLCIVLCGIGLWVVGRNGAHIGASGLVFALFGYLVAGAIWERRFVNIVIACTVLGLFSGLLWGVVPGKPSVSWEGHISGLIAGVAVRWICRR